MKSFKQQDLYSLSHTSDGREQTYLPQQPCPSLALVDGAVTFGHYLETWLAAGEVAVLAFPPFDLQPDSVH